MLELPWDDFLHAEPVRRAHSDLMRLTTRKVALHPRSLVPGVRTAFWTSSRETIHIFADEESPAAMHGIVHELCHAIHMEEGYHRLTGLRFDKYLKNTFSNEFQHPDIFRRMEAYGLDMGPYWGSWGSEMQRAFDEIANNVHSHSVHWEFPQVFTWFFFPQATGQFLNRYRGLNPSAFAMTRYAFEDAQLVGSATPAKHLRYIAIFKEHWFDACLALLPDDDRREELLESILLSNTRPVSEIVNERSEQMVSDHLREMGHSP
jgi:hypothetical protein